MSKWETLTTREQECYYYEGNGFNQVQTGILLFISNETVRSHLNSGKVKADCTTIAEAACDFSRSGNLEKMSAGKKQEELKRLKLLKEKHKKKDT